MTVSADDPRIDAVARELWQIEEDDTDEPGPADFEPWIGMWRERARRVLAVADASTGNERRA